MSLSRWRKNTINSRSTHSTSNDCDDNDIYKKHLNYLKKLITKKWCLGRWFRNYGQKTFFTRTENCTEKNKTHIPSKITPKLISKIIKSKKKYIDEFFTAKQKTKEIIKCLKDDIDNIDIYSFLEKCKSVIIECLNESENENTYDFFKIENFDKTLCVVLFHQFLLEITRSSDYKELNNLHLFTRYGGHKRRKGEKKSRKR